MNVEVSLPDVALLIGFTMVVWYALVVVIHIVTGA